MNHLQDSASGTLAQRTGASPDPGAIRVHLVSLGCPKNLVDSEMILGQLGRDGFVVTSDPEAADFVVINTCGFVQAAKEESIQAILEACQLKEESAQPKKVVVTGCLGQRYGRELRKEIPELDAIVGLGEYADLGEALRTLAGSRRRKRYFRVTDPTKACTVEVGRFRLTPAHYGYLRISEGCDNPCTFCAIPGIRGRFRSKPVEALEEEARELAASGASELVLISQDTTSYGADLYGSFELPRLLEKLADVPGVEWIRILYAYPAFMTDSMIDAVASIDRVVNYVDMPLQHISNTMLRRMGRRMMEARTRDLLERMRGRIPGLYLRTTFLVGFPGETDRDFATLRDFVRDFEFERLGVFSYSREEGTPSASFPDQVPEDVKQARLEELMLLQQEIAFRHNGRRVGETVEVLIDSLGEPAGGADPDSSAGTMARARSYGEAPEIDPVILIRSGGPQGNRNGRPADGRARLVELENFGRPPLAAAPKPGDRVRVTITGTQDYDLLATPLRP